MSVDKLIEKVTHVVEGIPYHVYHYDGGTTVQSPCQCFGHTMRLHSTTDCPWVVKREHKKRLREKLK